jgi:hypothetical protein
VRLPKRARLRANWRIADRKRTVNKRRTASRNKNTGAKGGK